MPHSSHTKDSHKLLRRTLWCAGFIIWAYSIQPLAIDGRWQPYPVTIAILAIIFTFRAVSEWLLVLAEWVEWFGARTPSGKDGTAHWARWNALKSEVCKVPAPFWGMLAGTNRPLFLDFESNAMCIAPAGSGKGIYTVIPNLFAIRASKVVADFKGELACICAKRLRARRERVLILNPSNLWSALLGDSESYNPMDMIVDDLYRPGGLRDVTDDLREMSKQIYPEPGEGEGENTYFRNGSRQAIADTILFESMVEGYDATLASVALLLEDRSAFENHMRWLVGVGGDGHPLPEGPMPIEAMEWATNHDPQDLQEFVQLIRARARNWLSLMSGVDRRTFDSFASGAQQALAPFAFGRLAPSMGRSTFSMDMLKDDPACLFIISDASRPEVYKNYQGLIQWCCMTAMKRHPNKKVPVYFILDEATNYTVHGLASLLTWGRSYGLRLLLIFQDLTAFEKCYGDKVLETLLSETEIKLFLPGQRSPKTLGLIKKLLGEQSVMSANRSPNANDRSLNENLSESQRALMTEDEIRRSHLGVLIVRRQPPARVQPVSYAQIHPWRKQAEVNPFHGKPFLHPVKLRIKEAKS